MTEDVRQKDLDQSVRSIPLRLGPGLPRRQPPGFDTPFAAFFLREERDLDPGEAGRLSNQVSLIGVSSSGRARRAAFILGRHNPNHTVMALPEHWMDARGESVLHFADADH